MVAGNWYKIGVLLLFTVCLVHSKEVFDRNKRSTTCAAKFTDIVAGHTACISRSSKYIEGEFNDDDIAIIVDTHNRVRGEVSPTATNMLKMSWDSEIAKIAQRWAENCEFQHDDNYLRYDFGRYSLGQNLAMYWASGGALNGASADWANNGMQGWIDEKPDYDYTSNSSPSGRVVGHYTQMIWASSHKIGCGFAHCDFGHFFVCNYGPSGNRGGQKPYTSGTTCSDCQTCTDGLCDCGDKTCYNDGTLNTDTCTCSCYDDQSFYIAGHCGLNCTDIENKQVTWKCTSASHCSQYYNIPVQCPDMCGWCPAAEYKETSSTASHITTSYFCITLIFFFSYMLY